MKPFFCFDFGLLDNILLEHFCIYFYYGFYQEFFFFSVSVTDFGTYFLNLVLFCSFAYVYIYACKAQKIVKENFVASQCHTQITTHTLKVEVLNGVILHTLSAVHHMT